MSMGMPTMVRKSKSFHAEDKSPTRTVCFRLHHVLRWYSYSLTFKRRPPSAHRQYTASLHSNSPKSLIPLAPINTRSGLAPHRPRVPSLREKLLVVVR